MLSRPVGVAILLLLAGTALPRHTDPFTGMAFVRIPAGTFTMGTPPSEPKREAQEAQHQVTLPRDFYLAIHEVTQRQWRRVTGDNPSNFGGCDTCPVERVTYHEVEKFLLALNAASSWPGFRLPTE